MVFKVSANGCGSSTAFVVASAAATGSGAARGFVVASRSRRGAGAARSGVLTGCRGAGAGAGGSALRFQVRTWRKVVESRGKSPGKGLETTELGSTMRFSEDDKIELWPAKIWPGSPGGHENQLLDLASWIKNQGCAPFCFPQKKGDLANDLPWFPKISIDIPCFPRSMVDLFISILHPIVPFCPSCSARKVRRPGGRRFVPFHRVVPVGKANITSHPPFTELFHGVYERLCLLYPKRGSYKGLQVYHRSRCKCCSFSKKEAHRFFLKIGYQASKIAVSTPFSHLKSYIWGIPTWKSGKIHHLHGMIFVISPTVMPPIYKCHETIVIYHQFCKKSPWRNHLDPHLFVYFCHFWWWRPPFSRWVSLTHAVGGFLRPDTWRLRACPDWRTEVRGFFYRKSYHNHWIKSLDFGSIFQEWIHQIDKLQHVSEANANLWLERHPLWSSLLQGQSEWASQQDYISNQITTSPLHASRYDMTNIWQIS